MAHTATAGHRGHVYSDYSTYGLRFNEAFCFEKKNACPHRHSLTDWDGMLVGKYNFSVAATYLSVYFCIVSEVSHSVWGWGVIDTLHY